MNETNREVSWRRRIVSTSAVFALVAAACINEFTPPGPPTYQYVRVVAKATGGDLDQDGYTVYVDGKRPTALQANGIVSLTVEAGTHEVMLAGVAANCTVTGANPRTVNVGVAEIFDVPFAVVCVPTGLAITMRTTGEDVPDALRLSVNDQPSAPVSANGSVTVGRLAAGSATLTVVAPPNCTVTGGTRLAVNVIANAITPVTLDVACTAVVREERIAYHAVVRTNGTTSSSIELVKVDGSGRVSSLDGSAPSWSPARSRIVFSNTACVDDFYYGDICGGGLVLLDPETGNSWTPPEGRWGFTPSWSAIGDAIAFTRPKGDTPVLTSGQAFSVVSELAVLQLPSATASPIAIAGLVSAEEPSWSPDGRRIAFVCHWPSRTDLCIVNRDGTGLVHLTDDILVERHPAWSPDGRTIAFTRYPDSETVGPSPEITLIDLSTGRITPINNGTDPAWSPDGSRLVFAGVDGLFVMRSDGTNRTRLTAGDHHAPAWRP